MKPILLNAQMVRAILKGQKTVTRRVVKPQPIAAVKTLYQKDGTNIWRTYGSDCWYEFRAPCVPGDILWVRETWSRMETGKYLYKADNEKPISYLGWHPSIHMPWEAARIFLRVTGVWAERLQDMHLIDCEKEGVQLNFVEIADLVMGSIRARERFSGVWDSTIKPKDLPIYGWDANPWVWVIEFERINKEEEAVWTMKSC